MDFETFDRLYKSDPLLFSLAMEVFLDKGRVATLESSSEELTIDLTFTIQPDVGLIPAPVRLCQQAAAAESDIGLLTRRHQILQISRSDKNMCQKRHDKKEIRYGF